MFNPEIATTEKLLTVTVPAYNAEAYLDTCLTSLCQAEVLGELEVLVIDDGSTDGTGVVAERYAARYPETVRVIHKENGGHGSGINRGAEEARGTYFKVVDADDWVEKEAFLRLMEFLRETETDIAASGFLQESCLCILFCFRHALRFEPPYQCLQGIHNMGADIPADQDVHDIIAQGKRSFIQPDFDVINALHPVSIGDACVDFFCVIGKIHAGNRQGIFRTEAYLRFGTLPHSTVMGQIHPNLGCTFVGLGLGKPLVHRGGCFAHTVNLQLIKIAERIDGKWHRPSLVLLPVESEHPG